MIKYLMSLYLFLCAGVLSAQDWHFEYNDELLNPYNIHTTGMNAPFTGDYDDDGDYDLIVGCRGGVLQYYENIGTPDSAIWQLEGDYFRTIELDTSSAPLPSLVDLDGDGLDELYLTFSDNRLGVAVGSIKRFINTGTQITPFWQESEFDIGIPEEWGYYHQFVDFDLDGDFDLLICGYYLGGQERCYYENTGDSLTYDFQRNDGLFENLDFEYTGQSSKTFVHDIIGDEKPELFIIVDEYDVDANTFYIFCNNGSAADPVWSEMPFWYEANYGSMFSLADLDNDSDKDMIIGTHEPPVYYNENCGNTDSISFKYDYRGDAWGKLYLDGCESLCLDDFDNDSDLDISVFRYYWLEPYVVKNKWESFENIGDSNYPLFIPGGFMPWFDMLDAPRFISSGDLNGDNFPELTLNTSPPRYYLNLGDGRFGYYDCDTLALEESINYQNPELADFNHDGLTDLIVLNNDNYEWLFYKNIGSATEPAWQRQTDWLIESPYPVSAFKAANLNRDDKMDIVGLCSYNYLFGFVNEGTPEHPEFVYDPAIFLGFENDRLYYFDCADLDGDGDDDIIYTSSGNFYFIENKTTTGITDPYPMLPVNTALLQNYPNPFNASTVISFTLDSPGEVTLTVYDILGREVETLIDGTMTAGEHSLTWVADSDQSSGVYFYKLKTDKETCTRQMVYIK